jgi:folate-binding protein YgfZ
LTGTGSRTEADNARRRVGLAEIPGAVLLRVTGKDRVSFLHRMLTCDAASLRPGASVAGLLLTQKGKVVASFDLGLLEDRVEIAAPAAARPALRDGLAKYVVADDVELRDRGEEAGLLSLVGPRAGAAAALLPAGPWTPFPGRRRAGLPAVDLLADAAHVPALRDAARTAAAAEGGGPLSTADLEVLRVENGVPALGAEATGETLPQECGLEDHVSFTKGCFLGQEPVARLHTQGHTNRGLAGLLLEPGAPVPPPGSRVLAGEKEVGAVTSAVLSAALARPIALAILRNDHATPGTALVLATSMGAVPCIVAPLPFV